MIGNRAQFLQPSHELDLDHLSDFEFGKIDLATWVAQLEQIDLKTAIQKVWVLLIELRRLIIDDYKRFALVAQLTPYLEHLDQVLKQHYLENVLIDEHRDQQLADLIIQLKINHAAIYYDIYRRGLAKKNHLSFFYLNLNKNKAKRLNISSAYLALNVLADLLYSRLLTKQAIFDGFWQVIYGIYNQAKSNGYLNAGFETESSSHFKTIDEIFHYILLLSILIQSQLRHYDICALKQCIVHWLPMLVISENPSEQARYRVDLTTDSAPQLYFRDHHSDHKTDHHSDDHQLYIILTDLVSYLDSTLHQTPLYINIIEEKLLTLPLKKYLLNVITHHPLRLQPRVEMQGSLQVALGLSSAHYFLSHARYFKESLQLESDLSIQTDIQTLSNTEHMQRSITAQRKQQYLEDVSKLYHVNMVDKSTTGYGLKWYSALPKLAQIDEFLLVREFERDAWSGAVIRWLRPHSDLAHDLGIERIADAMTAMAVSNPKIKDIQPVYHPAIYFVDKYHKECLILPSPNLFKDNQTLMLRFGTVEIKIYLQQTHSLMKNCVIFYFELLERSKKSLLDDFIAQQSQLSTSQDLWEALK